MRLSELSATTGVSTATIKFYLRSGLLHPAEIVSRTHGLYDESHVERLRLIRALRDISSLPIATIKTLLVAVDDETIPVSRLMGVVQHAILRPAATAGDEEIDAANDLVSSLGWTIGADSPVLAPIGAVLVAIRDAKLPLPVEPYAKAAEELAALELATISPETSRAVAARDAAIGAVLYGELLWRLRFAAQESASRKRFNNPPTAAAGAATSRTSQA